ncbi:hypothetical protein B0H15DRAFT_773816 [Mycena belliarum]|uniref:Uncharacterized protein n=1 Tax=Mycena belliarum TaxID=1033014 RepID=A0AAD6UB11_9AGAR|nr:hypothetical protein B0H15DRAFT_773816 [Mycena belliae]
MRLLAYLGLLACLRSRNHKGLNGRQAAWAARKYHGHRVLPESIMEEIDEAQIV